MLEGSFTTDDYPAATLTLSENGKTRIWGSDLKLTSVIALPTAVAAGQEVAGKVLVGYTNEANKEYSHDSEAPAVLYAPGANYTIAATADKLYAVYAIETQGSKTVNVDVLNYSVVGVTGTSYTTWSNKQGVSGAVYAGQSAGGTNNSGNTIQLRTSNSNSGIVSTTTGAGKVSKVTVVWNTYASNTLNVYGKNTAYTQATDLYNNTTFGDTLGSVDGTNTSLTISGSYDYIGIRSNSGAAYVDTLKIEWTETAASTYTKYATTGTKAPAATVDPTSVNLTAAAANGVVDVTYANVDADEVAVALFNDAECSEAFDGGWLTAELNGDNDIAYTAQAAVSYVNARTAYIKLTAPSTDNTIDPAIVVIPVTQAAITDRVFASLADLVASDVPAGDSVTVTLINMPIKDFYIYNSKRSGVVFDVQKDEKDIRIFKNNQTTIADWAVGGTLSGTFKAKWSKYSNEWQLSPASSWAWADLTYKAPTATAINNTEVEAQAVKVVENGQIFIIRGDKTYTLTGALVK